MILDDRSLLLQYSRSRDAEAFALLVQRYSTMVYAVACRVTGNGATAEDVTQDCFLTLARQAASIRGSLPAWLHRVALNRSLGVVRSESRRYRRQMKASGLAAPAKEPTWNEISPLVDAALEQLPDALRVPLVQHFLLGQTQTQVAESLGVNQATVSRRIQEGIETLRKYLKKAGVACGAVAISTVLAPSASASVPAPLAASLAKMAMAGPAKIAATTTHSAIITAKVKLIAAIGAAVVAGAAITYHEAPSLFSTASSISGGSAERPYLAKLSLDGDVNTQDSFSLVFLAVARFYGRDADYETVYALSTNAFCPAIVVTLKDTKSFWHIQARMGNRAIGTLAARYGLAARDLEVHNVSSDAAEYRKALAPNITHELDAGNVVLVSRGWSEAWLPWAGIITDVKSDGEILGATFNGRRDNQLNRPGGIWSLSPINKTLPAHEADIATLRSAIARIRGQSPYQASAQFAYGLQAMDAWIKAMSETPGFCPCQGCQHKLHNTSEMQYEAASVNAKNTQTTCAVAARYVRRIAGDFPVAARPHLESAAARYDHIVALFTPALTENSPDSYANILGDLYEQKDHVIDVLMPVKSEYAAIAQDLEVALKAK